MSAPNSARPGPGSPLKLPILGLCLLAGFCVIRFRIFRYVFVVLVVLFLLYLLGSWATAKLNRRPR